MLPPLPAKMNRFGRQEFITKCNIANRKEDLLAPFELLLLDLEVIITNERLTKGRQIITAETGMYNESHTGVISC
jgi:hypothetical protein